MNSDSIYGIFYFLFMSTVILTAAFFVTKYLSRKGFNRMGNKNLKIIETVSLGIDKSLVLVKAGGKHLLLGINQKNISMLAEIDEGKLIPENSDEVYDEDNDGYESYMDKFPGENPVADSIKQNLNKLKSIVRGKKTNV